MLEKLNSQNRYNIKLPSLLAALNSLLEDGGRVTAAAVEECISDANSAAMISPGIKSSDADIRHLSITSRQLSPDTTGSESGGTGTVDISQLTEGSAGACNVKAEPVVASRSFHNGTTRDNCLKASPHIANTSDARALVGTVYHQLREAEQRRKMLGSELANKPAAAAAVLSAAEVNEKTTPETVTTLPGASDDEAIRQSLSELVDEARRLPVENSERSNLVQQVIRSVIDAHMNTCNYTKDKIEIGMSRFAQVSGT